MLWAVFLRGVKLFVIGVVILYARIVAITLRTQRTQYRLQQNWRDLSRSTETFLVWVGVWIASQTLRLLKAILDSLEKASADVGEWILHHR